MSTAWDEELLKEILCVIYEIMGGDCADLPHNQASESRPYEYPQIAQYPPGSWNGDLADLDQLESILQAAPEGQDFISASGIADLLTWIGKVRESRGS